MEDRHLSLPRTRGSASPQRVLGFRTFAEVVGTSSRPEKRATGREGVESPSPVTELVNGGSAAERHDARKHDVLHAVKGRRRVGARPSSSREGHCHRTGRLGFVRTSVRASWEASPAAEGTSDRESARLSQGPRGTGLGGLSTPIHPPANAAAEEAARGGDRGARDGHRGDSHGKKNARAKSSPGRRSGCRDVKRDAPRPRPHRLARATRCSLRASHDERGESAREDALAWTSTDRKVR